MNFQVQPTHLKKKIKPMKKSFIWLLLSIFIFRQNKKKEKSHIMSNFPVA